MHRLLIWLAAGAGLIWAQKPPFDVNAMMKLARIGEHQISPDGAQVAFSVQTVDVEKNAKPRHIYVVPMRGGAPRKITMEGTANSRPRWSPDSKRIAYLSNRSGSQQIWTMDPDGGNQKQATNLATEADGVLWSGDGKWLVFISEVYPNCSDEVCNQKKLEEEKAAKSKVRIYTSLLYRHWDSWQTARRKHLLVVPAGGGKAKDLTPGSNDAPPFSLGGQDDYAISADSKEVCFTMNPDPQPALSTNSELYVVPIDGGDARKVSDNPGADNSPIYSPDGRYLAYRSQFRAGFEADRWRLMLMDRTTGRISVLTENMNLSIGTIAWNPDSKRIFFTMEDRGRAAIHMIPITGGASQPAVNGPNSTLDEPQFTADGKTMVYAEQSGSKPVELYRAEQGGSPVALTHLNDSVLNTYQLTRLEEYWVEGADRTQVHTFLVKPPNFDASQKYPVLVLIHGGPQGEWGENWTYRWNAQVFAAAGYVVIMPNPRGSTGYGQRFTDEVSGDWGGKVYDDLMASVDYAARLPYADPERMVAAGGSYGGYMVDWLLGHTQRFKALISHAGVYNLKSMAATEELWFNKWEFGGMPWESSEVYEKWSPSNFAKEFRTPTLVIAGELDFRVPYTQSLELFTALQVQKVPSKLMVFPDEGHWVLKPQNSLVWYATFLDWIGQYTKKP